MLNSSLVHVSFFNILSVAEKKQFRCKYTFNNNSYKHSDITPTIWKALLYNLYFIHFF